MTVLLILLAIVFFVFGFVLLWGGLAENKKLLIVAVILFALCIGATSLASSIAPQEYADNIPNSSAGIVTGIAKNAIEIDNAEYSIKDNTILKQYPVSIEEIELGDIVEYQYINYIFDTQLTKIEIVKEKP